MIIRIHKHPYGILYIRNLAHTYAVSGSQPYRDRIYIVKDIIMKLVEYGELNQTALVSFCGLNLKKHRSIFDKMESNGLINKVETSLGKRMITIYKPTQVGIAFCRTILEPYEKLFPRSASPYLIGGDSVISSNSG